MSSKPEAHVLAPTLADVESILDSLAHGETEYIMSMFTRKDFLALKRNIKLLGSIVHLARHQQGRAIDDLASDEAIVSMLRGSIYAPGRLVERWRMEDGGCQPPGGTW